MRIVFTCTPNYSHFHQLVPLAQAARDAGHEVAVATRAAFAPAVAAAGLRHLPAGLDRDLDEVVPERRALPRLERAPFMQRRVFAGLLAEHMISDLLRLAESWRPDVLVREEREYGGCVAAERLGLPHAVVGVNLVGDLAPRALISEPLAAHRAAYGLPPDPELAMLYRYLRLVPFPRRLQDPALPDPPTAHHIRPVPFDRSGEEGLPDWVAALPRDRPTVYVGLGTIFNWPAVFRAFLDGLCAEPVNVVLTVGRDQDPAAYGPQPGHVRIERYVPLSLLLPHCDLVVSNGGSGTAIAALAHGLPLVIVPIAADQPENAERCAAVGAATVVQPEDLTPATARTAVLTVLGDPAYRVAAGRVQSEVEALPGPEHALALLERLAAERRPIVRSSDRP